MAAEDGARSPTRMLAEGHLRVATGGGAPADGGIAVRHLPHHHASKREGAGGKNEQGNLEGADSVPSQDLNKLANGNSKVPATLDDYKRLLVPVIEEYFSTGDVELAASELKSLGSDQFHSYFVKKLISMAMDRHDKEKEMASILLSALYADLLSSSKMSEGFMLLLESTEDLAVDIPDAIDVLAVFVARAVVDEILPPVFLTRARALLPEFSKGMEVLQVADKSYLSAPHHAELVERKWGGSTYFSVEEAKKRIQDILREYVESGDTDEAFRCIRELGLPFFHHEVVKRALTLSMENLSSQPLILKLLKESTAGCLISSNQMSKGFCRLAESIDDLSLDIPSAKTQFDKLVLTATSEGWLDASFTTSSSPNEDMRNASGEKVKHFKEESGHIIQEYFLSDDVPELIRSLQELSAPEYNPIFLKKLITLALDKKNREKEMASVLLSSLSLELFSTDDIMKGFIMLLQSAEDTALDIVDAPSELALFLARAVIDEVLIPLNLDEISSRLRPNSSGSQTVQMARALLSARHSGERILRCWGGGTGWAVEDAKDKISKLLEEYNTGGDLGEACQCIRDLGMPFFNHEVVKKALVMAMEKQNETRILSLLQECFGEGLITINQMTKGFARVKEGLDDLILDIPNAQEKFGAYVDLATERGWLLASFASVP
ncbi:MA3 DOMAIN-CONTAINING TRANSLATION REGULATORY FACTOR 1-like [Oryza brachyantha]|uniref:MA3 DOMAIN-CONTAINING TRANSLATION REGULATORY FACTOR 1-like n=1 Tax=Oryza brachyantha TaxID=4533 RepID=UPI0007769989|nr:MA3 DOMAIN-CONTAINING TRANSLATION REGULATORY FACTOR 1-like [Oryza brachyantha]